MIDWIVDYALENGYLPMQTEIATAMDVETSTIAAWLREARARRLIDWKRSTPRTFQVPGVYFVDDRSNK